MLWIQEGGIYINSPEVRIDKWLWCVRVYKSRTLASDACDSGKVKIGGENVKPSHRLKLGDVIMVRQGFIKKSFKVLGLLNKRVSAKLLSDFVEDVTPEEEKQKALEGRFVSYQSKFKGMGRPTKKDRRLLEKLTI